MDIHVFYSAQLSMVTGCERETIALPDPSTVAECLDALVARHGESVGRLLRDEQGIRRSLVVCVNDKHVYELDRVNLTDGDEVVLLTAISGG